MNLEAADLIVGGPIHRGSLTLPVGMYAPGSLSVRKSCAGAIYGKTKNDLCAFYRAIILIQDLHH